MSKSTASLIESAIPDLMDGTAAPELCNRVVEYGLKSLPILARHLSEDMPIERLERLEALLKKVLGRVLNGDISGEVAREVARFQQKTGFLFKYKSYAIKAASPLGYSIFIQNENEGFSFQRHLSHKTEVFHILDVLPGGYVFVCEYQEWLRVYEEGSFAEWLSGKPDKRYDAYRFYPRPGDIFKIDEIGLVHTAIGCILEEFATVSTDMVDRLHDQNAGRRVPSFFSRRYFNDRLQSISFPTVARQVRIRPSDKDVEIISPVKIRGGKLIPLARSSVVASRYVIDPLETSDLYQDRACAASLYIAKGKGRLIMGEPSEARALTPPTLSVSKGDLLMVPSRIQYGFINEGSEALEVSEQRIPLDVAFTPNS
ncbi:MAG TPA: hypothetical protein VJQ56_09925 [Blastocatellia bacterium]|nr:hypothetical protein [Blastocatellia bacterium]